MTPLLDRIGWDTVGAALQMLTEGKITTEEAVEALRQYPIPDRRELALVLAWLHRIVANAPDVEHGGGDRSECPVRAVPSITTWGRSE